MMLLMLVLLLLLPMVMLEQQIRVLPKNTKTLGGNFISNAPFFSTQLPIRISTMFDMGNSRQVL
jgi:hypothetical protein